MNRRMATGNWGAGIGERRFAIRHSSFAIRYSLFAILFFFLSACGGAPTGATPTALPAGERIAQPAPVFGGASPTPIPSTTGGETAQPVSTAQIVDLQAQLATRLAESRAADTPSPVPTRRMLAELRSAASASILNRPTALGIVAGGANLFSAPNGAGIGFLPAGSTVTITGRSADGGWYAVYLEDSSAGWVGVGQVRVFGDVAELETVGESIGPAIVATMLAEASVPLGPIEVAQAATPVPTSTPLAPAVVSVDSSGESNGPQALVVAAGINVRSGPGIDFPIIGAFAQNDRLTLLARNEAGDWVEIVLPGSPESFGWAYVPLLQPDNPVADLPVSDRIPAPPPSE